MFKKILIAVVIVFTLLVGTLFAAPYLFKDQIKSKIAQAINDKVNAKVSFSEADLSLFKNFPNANVNIENLLIVNKAPFEGDTLVSLGELNLKMSIKELFKGKDEALDIDGISSKNGIMNIIFNKDGVANYDIALKNENTSKGGENNTLSFKIHDYKIENFIMSYFDEKSKMKMRIDSLYHEGTGDFTSDNLDLNTKSTAKIMISMDKTNYLKNVSISLDAIFGLDLKNSKYTFKQNKALINQLPIELDGFIQMIPGGQEYDLRFKTPSSSFKNFLALIPEIYSSSIEKVNTTGDFTVAGFAKGLYSDTTVPKFNIAIASHNATFQYPDLPKSVQNILIDTKIINETGKLNDTYINLDKLSFTIDKDVFNAKANIKDITQNPLINAALKGTINLANITKAYPVKLDKPLTGIFKADVVTKFDMQSVEKGQYQNINNAGTMSLTGFKYTDDKGKAMTINNALVQFNPGQVNLKQFNAVTGKSDLSITGILDNFYGYIFKNQELKGNFNMNSKQLSVADFMTTGESSNNNSNEEETKKESNGKAMKIPAFLNCTLTAKAATVLYDNLVLKDVAGKLIVKDEKVTLENIKTSIFGGTIGFNGAVSTKGKVPLFNMDLDLNQVDIAQSFTQLELLKKIAPIAGIINGKLVSNIKLNGTLDPKELTPDLKTLSGDILGKFLSTSINAKNSTLLNALTSNIKFIDLNKINLNDIKAVLNFKEGKVNVKPFNIKYQDVNATVGGTHGFDQNMNYNIKFDVPAKYLGPEVNGLLAKLSPTEVSKLHSIPINAILGGNFSSPKISTDIKQGITNLTTQLVNQQKEKVINHGKTAIIDLLQKNKKTNDTSKTVAPSHKEEVKTKATELLNGLFNKKKKTAEPKTE